ncbi:MAG TPA: hypothetical protein VEW48_22280 [Thermoanaerobaculia bacterium]|nr:hypothetical protein [Thermoanaerobaculia bacterium]
MHPSTLAVLALAALFAGPLPAQTPPPDSPPPAKEQAPPAGPAQSRSNDEGFLPRLDVYFPEGDLDLRVNRLIRKVFFEGQVKYNFVNGNISAFLRYRYYGYRRTTQFTVFDSIEFQEVKDFSNDFDRVRGSLFLFQWPLSYQRRTFLLTELDRISTNKPDFAEILRRGETNTFVRVGYQIGTPEDARSNSIVGETRARTERLFTAFREIGPGGAGFTGALTWGLPYGIGDFDYAKVEAETLKRFDISARTFLIGRAHAGTFLYKDDRPPEELPPDPQQGDLYTVPLGEYFRLDGRENLKGLSDKMRGTEELHTTWEYFFPWFLNASHDVLRLDWQNWYWILYAGAGNVGFDRKIYTDLSSYIPDAGVGFESSFGFHKYRFFLSAIVAQALKGEGGVEARFSVKSYR